MQNTICCSLFPDSGKILWQQHEWKEWGERVCSSRYTLSWLGKKNSSNVRPVVIKSTIRRRWWGYTSILLGLFLLFSTESPTQGMVPSAIKTYATLTNSIKTFPHKYSWKLNLSKQYKNSSLDHPSCQVDN